MSASNNTKPGPKEAALREAREDDLSIPAALDRTKWKEEGSAKIEAAPSVLDWRKHLRVHPAAEMFPTLAAAELQELAEDIRANGLRVPPVAWSPADGSEGPVLLDGRNRLDALAELDLLYVIRGHLHLKTWTGKKWAVSLGGRLQFQHLEGGDPYALVISLNVLRRHLTAEKRIELAEELAKADPTMSARRIAKLADISPTTAVKAKTKVQETGDVSTVDTSISVDTKGRKQPAKKRKPKLPSYIPTQEAAPKPIAPSPASTPKGASGVVELAHKHIAEIVGLMRLMTQPERLRFRQEMLRAVADEMVTPPGDAA